MIAIEQYIPSVQISRPKMPSGVVYIRYCDTKFGYKSWFDQKETSKKKNQTLEESKTETSLTKLFLKAKCQSLR